MKTVRSFVCLAALLVFPAAPIEAQEVATAFDTVKGWTSFVHLLHENYDYFDRPEIDGEAILAAFADRSKAARSDRDFINVLQLVSHNFADPHFVVGLLDAGDWSVIPTASDLFGMNDGKDFQIGEVRAGGDAAMKGMRPGMAVERIDGLSPRAAIEAVTGWSFADLSPVQIGFASNVALTGHRKQGRTIEVRNGRRRRLYALAATNDLRTTLDIVIADQSLRGTQLLLAASRSDVMVYEASLLAAVGTLDQSAFAAGE